MNFLDLLRFSVAGGDVDRLADGDVDWRNIHECARQQSLLGVMFRGIEQLPKRMRPPRDVLLTWYAEVQQIRQSNCKVNENAAKLSAVFQKAGFWSCVLKGQGNNLLYPDPYTRMAGDIDIWVKAKEGDTIQQSIAFARKHHPDGMIVYHHVDAGMFCGTEVEIHFRPSFMNNLVCNLRLQQWFEAEAKEQFVHSVELPDGAGHICVPTNAFNRIYQMVHISNHFFHEGIGLRQLVDYYYVLQQGFSQEEQRQEERLMKWFGIYKIATAVMFVLGNVLGLPREQMIVPSDERRGKLLLEEIMLAGNFGHFDKRLAGSHTPLKKNIQRLKRDVRLMWLFPSECLWEPIFRLYHFFWRMRNN